MKDKHLTILMSYQGNHDSLYRQLVGEGHRVILQGSPMYAKYLSESAARLGPSLDKKMEGWSEDFARMPRRRSFVVSGHDVSAEVYRQYFGLVPSAIRGVTVLVDAIRQMHEDFGIDACIVHNEEAPNLRAMVNTCKALGVPSIHVTHGAFLDEHPYWCFHDRIRADKVCVESVVTRDQRFLAKPYNRPEQIVVTGRPAWDKFITERPPSKETARRQLGYDMERPIFLIASQWVGTWVQDYSGSAKDALRYLFEALKGLSAMNPRIVIRLHPGHKASGTCGPEYHEEIARECGVQIEFSSGDLLQAVAACSVFCSFDSTINGVAVILKKPTISVSSVVREESDPRWQGGKWGRFDGVLGCYVDRKSIGDAVRTALTDSAYLRELPARQAATMKLLNCGNDGRATERILDVLFTMAAEAENNVVREKPISRMSSKEPLEACDPGVPAIDLPGGYTERILCIPDWSQAGWQETVQNYVRTYEGRKDVQLVVRVEPVLSEMAELANKVISALVSTCGVNAAARPAVLVHAAALDVERRPGLFTACTSYISSGGIAANASHARACGLPVYETIQELGDGVFSGSLESQKLQKVSSRPGISVLMVTYNSAATVEACLESFERHSRSDDEIIIVDNASSDDTVRRATKTCERLKIAATIVSGTTNIGFSRGVSACFSRANKDVVLLLNPDTVLTEGCLDRMVRLLMSSERIGAVGPTSDWVAGLQKVGLLGNHHVFQSGSPEQIAAHVAALAAPPVQTKLLIGLCLMMRRSLFEQLGGLDHDLFAGSDDLLLSYQIREAGYELLVARDTFVHHVGQVSFDTRAKLERHYLGQQSQNRVYEKLYERIGERAADGMGLFDMSWYAPVTDLVSIVVVAEGSVADICRVLERLGKTTSRALEVLVVTDQDEEEVRALVASNCPYKLVVVGVPEGTRRVDRLNEGIYHSSGKYVTCLDGSTRFANGWLANLLTASAMDPKIGIVGPRLSIAGGSQGVPSYTQEVQSDFDEFADDWFVEHAGLMNIAFEASSSCVLLSRELIDAIGGFDNQFIGQLACDSDFCVRAMRAGFKVARVEDVFVHNEYSPSEQLVGSSVQSYDSRAFRLKYDAAITVGQDVLRVVDKRPFHERSDHIDPSLVRRLGVNLPPIDISNSTAEHLLMIPDWASSQWHELFVDVINLLGSDQQTALLVRVEPPDEEAIRSAASCLQSLIEQVQAEGLSVGSIILETSPVVAGERAALYAAAAAFLPCGGRFASTYLLEAHAAGLPILGNEEERSPSPGTPELATAK